MTTLKKPRLLFVCSRPPYPPVGGDRLKNYYLIPELWKSFELTIVCTSSEALPSKGRAYLEQYGTLHLWHKSQIDFARNVIAWPFRLPIPLQASLYHFKDVGDQIRSLAPSHDAIFCNLIRTAPYAEGLKIRRFCDIADNMGSYYANLMRSRKLSPMSIYCMLDQPYIERYERVVVDSFDQSFLFNPDELNEYKAPSKLTLIPHGVNPRLIERETAPDSEFNNTIVFLGKMNTVPNAAAVEWFATRVVPMLPEAIHFAVIGANPPGRIKALENHRVKVLGFVEDPYPALRGALAVVAPMQVGSGIQNKVLEAMAVGGLCILTPSPAKALEGAEDGREFLIADEPGQFAQLINKIASDPKSYNVLRNCARSYIVKKHSWKRAGSIYTKAMMDHLSGV
jgi:glycosyltransferase involved in cell wall biosynthesis